MTKKFVAYQLLIDVIDYSLMLLIIHRLLIYAITHILLLCCTSTTIFRLFLIITGFSVKARCWSIIYYWLSKVCIVASTLKKLYLVLYVTYQTRKAVFDHIPKHREQFLTSFEVFENVIKQCLSCLIYLRNRN